MTQVQRTRRSLTTVATWSAVTQYCKMEGGGGVDLLRALSRTIMPDMICPLSWRRFTWYTGSGHGNDGRERGKDAGKGTMNNGNVQNK